jgi:hypothetical protein
MFFLFAFLRLKYFANDKDKATPAKVPVLALVGGLYGTNKTRASVLAALGARMIP